MIRIESALAVWSRGGSDSPKLRWIQRWGISICSLFLGIATLFVFRRGLSYFPWILGSLLLIWVAGVVCADARVGWAGTTGKILSFLIEYTVQTLLHGLFLFLLPIYYGSATFWAPTGWYVVVLGGAALLTTIDPWYRAVLHRIRSLELILFALGWFSCLNLALALLGLNTTWALVLSGVGTLLALLPVLLRVPAHQRTLAAMMAGLGLLGGPWLLREAIPPVPLQLVGATFARGIEHLEPVMPVREITADELRGWGKLWVWSAVVSPIAVEDSVYHVWIKDGVEVASMPRKAIVSQPGGYRIYSWKSGFGSDPVGVWLVEVRTTADRLIGRAWLRVVP